MPIADWTRLAEGFGALVGPFDLAMLEQMPATVCGLRSDLRLGYVNPAWIDFGVKNGGPWTADHCGLGVDVLLVTPPVLRPFYEDAFRRARETEQPVEHDYECSSPARRRVFRMRIHPCPSGVFVVVNSLLREEPHGGEVSPALSELYRDGCGLILQCANCRRVRRAGTGTGPTAEWDWVPEYVAHMPPRTSHGICYVCVDYHYSL